MVEYCTISLHIAIHANKLCAVMSNNSSSRHEVAIVFPGPAIGTVHFCWNHDGSSLVLEYGG